MFLHGNDLPGRFAPGFHVAELGFGTGLNFLATLDLWVRSGQQGWLLYTAFEAYPMSPGDMARALSPFPDLFALGAFAREAVERGDLDFEIGPVRARIVHGDARATLPLWDGKADAWYLDGFAPSKNPEMWEEGLLREVAAHTRPGGTLATFTAAGPVRRALERAGFRTERIKGFGRKRHMTIGRRVGGDA